MFVCEIWPGVGVGYVITPSWPGATSNYLMDDPQHYYTDIISPNTLFYIHNIGSVDHHILCRAELKFGKFE